MLQTHSFSALAGFSKVDPATRTIFGVSVITEGPAKGHGKVVDSTTVKQIFEVAKTHSSGVKVKMGHKDKPTLQDTCGRLTNFVLDGKQLRADLTLLETDPNTSKILELAQTAPEDFGLSTVFGGVDEMQGTTRLSRCAELYSVDIVDRPAANPTGLFSEKTNTTMFTKEIMAPMLGLPATASEQEVLTAFQERLKPVTVPSTTALEAKVNEAVTRLSELQTAATNAATAAEAARKSALVAEAGREGKVIPLSVEGIAKTSFEVLDEIVKALPKGAVQTRTQTKLEVPTDASKKAEFLSTKNREGVNAFNEIHARATGLSN